MPSPSRATRSVRASRSSAATQGPTTPASVSGGSVTKIDLGDFLGRGKTGSEHQALARLIGSLVD